jgi:hypothetical protein
MTEAKITIAYNILELMHAESNHSAFLHLWNRAAGNIHLHFWSDTSLEAVWAHAVQCQTLFLRVLLWWACSEALFSSIERLCLKCRGSAGWRPALCHFICGWAWPWLQAQIRQRRRSVNLRGCIVKIFGESMRTPSNVSLFLAYQTRVW